jgi:epoxide hydrolase
MRPFRVEIPQADLEDLHRRIEQTRWPTAPPDPGWARGVPLPYLKDLAGYWAGRYDWRAAEARLNRYPQFIADIDGASIHVLHVRSPEPWARPLVLTHGWPGSVAEFLDVVDPLADPRAHGGDPRDAFHVVVPSIPGFGFSGPTADTGWHLPRIARAWAQLMSRLGYDRYFAQGGDAGAWIALTLATLYPERVAGVHVNFLPTPPPADPAAIAALDARDADRLARLARFLADGTGYMKLQSTRPDTIAYALTDSPVGQLAWIVEKFREWTDSVEVPEEAVDRDLMLTNVMIYWLTGTAGSSARLYWELADYLPTAPVPPAPPPPPAVPLGVAAFPRDPGQPVRRFAQAAFPTIVHWTDFEHGGHFAAMEQPAAFVADVRAFAAAVGGVTAPPEPASSTVDS